MPESTNIKVIACYGNYHEYILWSRKLLKIKQAPLIKYINSRTFQVADTRYIHVQDSENIAGIELADFVHVSYLEYVYFEMSPDEPKTPTHDLIQALTYRKREPIVESTNKRCNTCASYAKDILNFDTPIELMTGICTCSHDGGIVRGASLGCVDYSALKKE